MNAPLRRLSLVFGSVAALGTAAACAGSPSAPEPAGGSRASTSPTCTTPADSVQSGYGNCPTGGLEYTEFEYEPETGTEYVVTPDTTASKPSLTPTTTTTTPPPPPPPAPAPPK